MKCELIDEERYVWELKGVEIKLTFTDEYSNDNGSGTAGEWKGNVPREEINLYSLFHSS